MNDHPLRLHHELMLLLLHDEKGTHAHGTMTEYGLGGAIFSELLLAGRLRVIEEGKRKRWVEIIDASPMGESVMDQALQKLASSKRRASPQVAVSRIAHLRRLWHSVAGDLARMGVVRETEKEILRLFRLKRYPTLDPVPEQRLVERIRAALAGGETDARTAMLISVASATSALSAIYSRKELRALKPRIAALAEADDGSRATREAIQTVMIAIVAATAAAAAAS